MYRWKKSKKNANWLAYLLEILGYLFVVLFAWVCVVVTMCALA